MNENSPWFAAWSSRADCTSSDSHCVALTPSPVEGRVINATAPWCGTRALLSQQGPRCWRNAAASQGPGRQRRREAQDVGGDRLELSSVVCRRPRQAGGPAPGTCRGVGARLLLSGGKVGWLRAAFSAAVAKDELGQRGAEAGQAGIPRGAVQGEVIKSKKLKLQKRKCKRAAASKPP